MSFYGSFLLLCLSPLYCSATNSITRNEVISDPGFIESNGSLFRAGFLGLNGSTNRYFGIWYNTEVPKVAWIANRNNPLTESSGVFRISDQGDLLVSSGEIEVVWSTHVSTSGANSSSVQLLDSGNLLLQDVKGNVLWQSFDHPADSFWSTMTLSLNALTNENRFITSWRSLSDPSDGNFTAGIVYPLDIIELFIWSNGEPYWRSGPYDGRFFIGVPPTKFGNQVGLTAWHATDVSVYIQVEVPESLLAGYQINSAGILVQWTWDGDAWDISWTSRESECDVYAKCGVFGICNANKSPVCSCMPGFKPINSSEWNAGNWTSGCSRTSQLNCVDDFIKLQTVKVPDHIEWLPYSEKNCSSHCFKNCYCIAYSFHKYVGCMTWSGGLIDVQEFGTVNGTDLYLRVGHSQQGKSKDYKAVIVVAAALGSAGVLVIIFIFLKWRSRRGRKSEEMMLFNRGEGTPFSDNDVNLQGMTLYSFDQLATATGNFDSANKLGQGGFGPVYKGAFAEDGKEIAVKRLSRASGQGLAEFMNEVVVISKLQHRNLVRLLGCCIDKDEKMLVYEYMPKKSLDAYIFSSDPLMREQLNWRKRFEIIEGIARGLLYLHRDSRLRIIHRDLKPSNILLDEELNPKISDFGMARIFESNQDQANTQRIAGTYGYMSPEYAMGGMFSEKSDVFSFGVLLLEIVSCRRNTSFHEDDSGQGLLGLVWNLWNEGRTEEVIDSALLTSSGQCQEILRCIHIGLLCVQDLSSDRPSVSTILRMLTSEILDLPSLKQPAFVMTHPSASSAAAVHGSTRFSVNGLTITDVQGR